MDALRRESALERDRLQRAVEQEGQEAGREKARLRAEVEEFRRDLDGKKEALRQEKVWAGPMCRAIDQVLLIDVKF